jgi:hypothetical protein
LGQSGQSRFSRVVSCSIGEHALMRPGGSFLGSEGAAMGAVAADLGAGERYLESEVLFDLPAHFLERLAEVFFDFSAAQADDVRVFLFEARFVIMLIPGVVHQVELVNQPAFFEQFQRPVDGDAIEFRVLFFRELIETFGVEMEAGVINQIEQDAALASQPDASVAKGILDAGVGHVWFQGSKEER